MRIEKNNTILDLDNLKESVELDQKHLMIDYDNIEGDYSIAPLYLYKIGQIKAEIDHEVSCLEQKLERLFYEKCRGRRVSKTSLPNSSGSISPLYPTNNQQVFELVYSDKDYQEARSKLENSKKESSLVSNFFFAYKEKCRKLDILWQKVHKM
jgi:hypothetical protein